MTDEQAVKLAKIGQRDAFRDLYERHKTSVYSIASRYARTPQDAEDILQETFIKAFRAIGGFANAGDSHFEAWIHKICFHRCIDQLRKAKRRHADRTDSFTDCPRDFSAGGPSPERSADNGMLLSQVRRAFAVLSPRRIPTST